MRGRENSRKTSGFDTKCLPQIHPKNDSHQPTTPTTQIAHTHHINHHQSPPKNHPSLFLSHRPKYTSTISLDWPHSNKSKHNTLFIACFNPHTNMLFLSRIAQLAFKDSMIHKICNSHYLSHFATFFIDTRPKRSAVDNCSSHKISQFPYQNSVPFQQS